MKKPLSRPASAAVSLLVFVLVFLVLFCIFFFVEEIKTSLLQRTAFLILCPAFLAGFASYGVRRAFRAGSDSEFSKKAIFYPLCAFGLSFIVLLLSFIFSGVWPFGNRTVLTIDLYHQYAPLLSQFSEILKSGRSLGYTLRVGLGASVIPMAGYYLASPFNLILLLFPQKYLSEGIFLIIMLKLSLSGMTFAACAQYMTKKRGPFLAVSGALYACMMYALAYFWNLMWLDAFMMLPLLILLFTRITRTGKWGLYTLALAYVLITNYYIAFMVCVFLVLWAIAYVIGENDPFKNMLKVAGKFALGSLLAAGIAAFMLLPVIKSLGTTSAAGSTLPFIDTNETLLELIEQMLWNPVPTVRSGNPPNLYCGLICVILLPVYLGLREVPVRRKISRVFLLFALAVSMGLNIPNLLWHGLHYPNDLPYRYSFLFSFVMILIAAECACWWRTFKARALAVSIGFWAVMAILCEAAAGAELWVTYLTLIMLGIHAAVLCAMALCRGGRSKKIMAWMCLTAVVLELAVSSIGGIAVFNGTEVLGVRSSYVASDNAEAVRKSVSQIKQIAADERYASEYGGEFYRMEFLPRITCVDTALFDYMGVTTFASSNSYAATMFMKNIGFACNGVNSYMYRSFVRPVDSLLGIRYLAFSDSVCVPEGLVEISSESYNGTHYTIYENPQALSIGYAVSEDLVYIPDQINPFTYINSIFTRATGTAGNVFDYLKTTIAEGSEGAAISRSSSSYSITAGGYAQVVVFNITVPAGKEGFCYPNFYGADSVSVDGNGCHWALTVWEPYIISFPLNDEEVTYSVTVTASSSLTGRLYATTFNDMVYETAYSYLEQTQLRVESFSDDHIKGSFTAKEPGLLFTTIPYDAGWEAWVDGEKVECTSIKDAMLAVPVSAGSHTVELSYTTPGIRMGALISLASLAFFLFLMLIGALIDRRRRKDSQLKQVLSELRRDSDEEAPVNEEGSSEPAIEQGENDDKSNNTGV